MKMNVMKAAGCRELNEHEALMVAGGEDIVVTGHRENNLYLLDYMSSDGGGGGGYGGGGYGDGGGGGGGGYVAPADAEEEIVVTGTPMTDDQKVAFDAAHDRAVWDMWVVQTFGMGALVFFGRAGGVIAAGAGTALSLTDQDELINRQAEQYYHLDGLDGVHDGFSELDRQMYGHERYPGY